MRSDSTGPNRLLLPCVFVFSLAGMWALRWGFSTSEPAAPALVDTTRPRAVPFPSGGTLGSGPAGPDLTKPEGLFSVKSGWVVWPENGESAAVNEAFKAALEKLKSTGLDSFEVSEATARARQIFADWWKVDPQGVERYVSEPPGQFLARGGMLLLPFLMARDAQYAWDLAGRVVEPQSIHWVRADVLKEMARLSPDRVLALAAGLQPFERRMAEEAALKAWPVEQALAWCAKLPSAWKRSQLEYSLVKHLISEDPAKAAAMLRAGSLPVDKVASFFPGDLNSNQDRVLRFARTALASDPDPMASCLWAAQSQSVSLGAAAFTAFFEQQTSLSGSTITSLASKLPKSSLVFLAAALGSSAPQEGLSWAVRDTKTMGAFFKAWAGHDPANALAAAETLPQSQYARLTIAEKAAQSAPEIAIAALRSFPDQAQASPILLKAAREIAYQDPALALEALASASGTSAVEVSVVLAIGGRIDPQATANALAQYDLPVSDYVAVESFTRGWATANPEAASQWVTALPPGGLRDGGAAGLAIQVGAEDTVGGYLWAMEIREAALRSRVLALQPSLKNNPGPVVESLLRDPRLNAAQQSALRTYLQPRTSP